MKKKTTKAKSTPKAKADPIEPRIVKAAMDIAAAKGWAEVSSVEVAKRAKVNLKEVRELCPDKTDLLHLLAEEINIAMLAGGKVDGGVRDNLFELIMRRLEAALPYRAGIRAVAEAARQDPGIPLRLAGDFHDALGHVLDMAGVNPTPLHRLGLAAVALATINTFLEDDSDDLSATMAALDKRLGQLESVAGMVEPLLRRAA